MDSNFEIGRVGAMKYLWLFYPLAVLIVILFGTKYLLEDGSKGLTAVFAKKSQVETVEQRLVALNKKISDLNKVDAGKMESELKFLLSAMPASKEVWPLLKVMRNAAAGTGAEVFEYTSTPGEIKDASSSAISSEEMPLSIDMSYTISSFEDVVMIIDRLQNFTPLVKINDIKLDSNKLTLTVEGAWSPWGKIVIGQQQPLPTNYDLVLADVKKRLEGFQVQELVPVDLPEVSSGSGIIRSPF